MSQARPDPLEDDSPMETDIETIITGLRRLVAEEMHLLGQELEDSLDGQQSTRLDDLGEALDRTAELLAEHRAARPIDRPE